MWARLKRIVIALIRVIVIGLSGMILLLTLSLAACRSDEVPQVIPSPDRRVSLLLIETYSGITGPGFTEVYLQGRGKAVKLGQAPHLYGDSGYGWTNDATVNVCALHDDPRPLKAVVITTEFGDQRRYEITSGCDDHRPLGYDYGGTLPVAAH